MAQLVAHHTGSVGVTGSSPVSSTEWETSAYQFIDEQRVSWFRSRLGKTVGMRLSESLRLGLFFLCRLVSDDGQYSAIQKNTGNSIWFGNNSRSSIEIACLGSPYYAAS